MTGLAAPAATAGWIAAIAGAALAVAAVPAPAAGQEVITQQEALRLAFPEPAAIDRRTAFLDSADLARARETAGAGVEVEGTVVTHYVGTRRDTTLGVAYFDAHPVRTLPEVLMIVVRPDGRVGRVELLKFAEPQEYRPPEAWLGEFEGMDLGDRLSPGGDVVNITGATLTSRAVSRAVRRVLALHRVIAPLEGSSGAEPSSGGEPSSGREPPSDREPSPSPGSGR